MGQAIQLEAQAAPQAAVRIDISVKLNGSEVNSSSRVQNYGSIGVDPLSTAADIFDLFAVSNDGTDVITTELTLTGLADIVPMRIEWNYDEEKISAPGTYHNVSQTLDFDGVSFTQTYSAHAVDYEHTKGIQTFEITGFVFPN